MKSWIKGVNHFKRFISRGDSGGTEIAEEGGCGRNYTGAELLPGKLDLKRKRYLKFFK